MMKEIKRITIKSSSGYCPMEYVYHDRLSITAESITYEYEPYIQSAKNSLVKWSYKTNNTEFAKQFKTICKLTEKALKKERQESFTDVGTIDFCITYADNTRTIKETDTWDKSFRELFDAIRKMTPQSERVPVVIE